MPTAEARLATDRASRYLAQLCRHLGQMNRMAHQLPGGHGRMMPAVQHVDYTDTHGTVRFADGQWILDATADALKLRVDADDEEALRRLQEGIAARIEKIGRRDGLKAHWRPTRSDAQPQTEVDAASEEPGADGNHGHRRKPRALVAVGAAIVAVAVHLGIGGAALSREKWTGWTVNAVLVILVVKLLFMGGHLILGRRALRFGGVLRRRTKHHEQPAADTAS